MPIKIGLPRGLWFYDYGPLWIGFYQYLGAEVVVSPPSNQEILNLGVKATVEEACLPLKIFNGHLLSLKDQVDYLFVPRVMSVYPNEYICPKFCGLPELARCTNQSLPPLIDTTINFNRGRRQLWQVVYRLGSYVTKNPVKIKRAYEAGLEAYRTYCSLLADGWLPIDGEMRKQPEKTEAGTEKNLVVLGHPYQLYDSFSSMGLLEKLLACGARIIIPEMLQMERINQWAATLEKPIFWSYGRKVLGTALQLANQPQTEGAEGIIYVSAFGCGIDSIVADLLEKWTRKSQELPYLLLTLDEHTGEAGMDTRVEAFMDMLDWRKKDARNLSPHGKSICGHQGLAGRASGGSGAAASL